MTFKPYITHLTEVTLSNIRKSEKKVVIKFLSVLQHIEKLNLATEQENDISKFVDSLRLKTYRGGNIKIIKRKLDRLTSYLMSEFSMIPEGHFLSNGITLGSGFGLALSISMVTALEIAIPMAISFGLVTGLIIGMLYGWYMDESAKRNGRVISLVSN